MLASLGKAFGLTGGVISDSLSTNCRKRGFVSSAGMNPALPKQYPTPTKSIFFNKKLKTI
jgi:hypothetical protein